MQTALGSKFPCLPFYLPNSQVNGPTLPSHATLDVLIGFAFKLICILLVKQGLWVYRPKWLTAPSTCHVSKTTKNVLNINDLFIARSFDPSDGHLKMSLHCYTAAKSLHAIFHHPPLPKIRWPGMLAKYDIFLVFNQNNDAFIFCPS